MGNYISKNFWVNFSFLSDRVLITQQILAGAVNTSELPGTMRVLRQNTPSIFRHTCINGKKHCFRKEAVATEVGHLFEHLILENLKERAMEEGEEASFSGETCWDWFREDRGRFNIVIYLDKDNIELFCQAYERAIKTLEEIYSFGARNLRKNGREKLSRPQKAVISAIA